MQAISGEWQADVLALVSSQQKTHVKIVIEIVRPGFIKSRTEQIQLPEMSRLRGRISPRKTLRRRLRHHRATQLCLVSLTKHDCVAANPFRLRVRLKMFDHGRERAGQV